MKTLNWIEYGVSATISSVLFAGWAVAIVWLSGGL